MDYNEINATGWRHIAAAGVLRNREQIPIRRAWMNSRQARKMVANDTIDTCLAIFPRRYEGRSDRSELVILQMPPPGEAIGALPN